MHVLTAIVYFFVVSGTRGNRWSVITFRMGEKLLVSLSPSTCSTCILQVHLTVRVYNKIMVICERRYKISHVTFVHTNANHRGCVPIQLLR